MDSFLKKAKMFALMAAMVEGRMQAEPVFNTRMKKRNPNKPGPTKEVREARKRQKAARKQNRKH